MTVAIRRACGAAALSLPMPWTHWISMRRVSRSYRYLPSGTTLEPRRSSAM